MPESIPQYKPKGDSPSQDKVTPKRGATGTGKKSTRLAADRPFKHTIPQIREALENGLGLAILGLSTKAALNEDATAEKDADILTEHGPELIDSWVWLAEKNNSVRRALEMLCGGGGYLTFFMANLTVVLAIAQNHGYYPEEWPTPGTLKSVVATMSSFGNGNEGGIPNTD